MAQLILQIISQGLGLVDKLVPDQATKIRLQINEYKEQWNAEFAKGEARDDAKLDMLDRQLLDIGQLFLTAINSAQSQNKPSGP